MNTFNPFKTTEHHYFTQEDSLEHIMAGMSTGVLLGLAYSLFGLSLQENAVSIYELALQTAGIHHPFILDNYHNSLLLKIVGDITLGGIAGTFLFSPYYKAEEEHETE